MKSKKEQNKIPVAVEVPKTEAQRDNFSGPIKQMQKTCYKAHLKDGVVVQGKIELSSHPGLNNETFTYNEKGSKIREQSFHQSFSSVNIYNDKRQQIESIHYDKDGKLTTKTTHTYNEQGKMIGSLMTLADGSLYYRTEDKFDDE